MEATMVKWPWSREPQEPQEKQFLACPTCGEWAFKENLDRALAKVSDLTCEICGTTKSTQDWSVNGFSKAQLEAAGQR